VRKRRVDARGHDRLVENAVAVPVLGDGPGRDVPGVGARADPR
jgi:hypothetical protein